MPPRLASPVGLFIVAVGCSLPAAAVAQTVTEYSRDLPAGYTLANERFGNYPGGFFAPRVEWARPSASGRLSVLLFAPTPAARDAVELASRLDAQVDLIVSSGNGGFETWHADRRGDAGGFYAPIPSKQALDDRAAAFLSPACRHDAIIIGRLMWTIIPEKFRQQILTKVKAGTALVLVTPWGIGPPLEEILQPGTDKRLENGIRATVPLAMLPLEATLEPPAGSREKRKTIGPFEVVVGTLGEGRVAAIQYNDFHHYAVLEEGKEPAGVWAGPAAPRPRRLNGGGGALTPLHDFGGDDPLFYDYWFSILGKALLHATGREPAVRLRPDTVSAECRRESLPATPVAFALDGPARPGMSLEYEIRDRQGGVIDRGTREVGDDAATLRPRFPVVPPGLYVVDVWLKRAGLTIDWASAAVTVTGPRYLEAVAPAKEFFQRQEGISGTVALHASPPAGHRLVVELWDTHGRLEQRLELRDGETAFRFAPIEHPLSRAYRIVAAVQEGEAVVDSQERWTGLPSNEIDGFQFVCWDAALGGREARIRMRLQKEYGLTGYFDMAQYLPRDQLMASADLLAQNNLTAWPLCYGLSSWSPKRYGDLLNGPWKEQFRQVYRDRTDAYKRYGTLAYGIDSESDFDPEDAAWDVPAGREDYRRYLKGRYRDVATVNALWGTSLVSFDDIGFITFAEAKVGRHPSRWLDQQRYRRDRFNDAAEYSARLVREFDPGARVSHDIAVVPAKPSWDFPRMATVIDAFIQSELEHFNKRHGDRLASGWWFGTYQNEMSEWRIRTAPWETLFQGGRAIAWFPGNQAFTTDLSAPLLAREQAAEEVRDIRSGIDRLLMSGSKRVDPILIFWSWESWMAGIYHPLPADWPAAAYAAINLCRRVGLDFQCVGEDFLCDDLRFGPDQRVLFLPASQAISREAVEKIRGFAAAGGVVIADFKPATVDEHLRPYGTAPATTTEASVEMATCGRCQGKKIIHLGGPGDPLGNCPACGGTGLVAKGSASTPDTSLLEDVFEFSAKGIKPFQKGQAVFLAGLPAQDDFTGLRRVLVAKGGVPGGIEIRNSLGGLRTDLRSYVFDNGPAVMIGVLPDKTIADPPGEDFSIALDRKMHVYNVRNHAYLGHDDFISAGILPARAGLFAALPARIEGLEARPLEPEYHPGQTVEVAVEVLPATLADVTMAVRMELLRNGTPAEPLTTTIAVKGKATHPVPLALNQPPGEYVLRATEVISGRRIELPMRVKR